MEKFKKLYEELEKGNSNTSQILDKFEEENNNGKIKFKNPYFKNVLKYLVDMFIFKKKNL